MENRKMTQRDISFGKRLKKLRKTAGMSQEELAAKAKVSLPFIGMVETGKRRMSVDTMQKVARVLGVKVSDLLPF